MKNFVVIPILLFILLMIVYQCTHAQDMVITSKGDTLKGEVKQLNSGVEKKVQVITADKKRSTFSIFQTLAYTYKGEIFHPVKMNNVYIFMKLKKQGYLSLYEFQRENQTTYDGQYLTKKDGASMEVPNLGFKKYMNRFLGECPDVTTKLDKEELTKKDLEKIIDEFNRCIENNTIDHNKEMTQREEQVSKTAVWNDLEEKVKNKPDFEGKQDALEMIGEIKKKISNGEKIPNFLVEGLKSSLSQAGMSADLENALRELED